MRCASRYSAIAHSTTKSPEPRERSIPDARRMQSDAASASPLNCGLCRERGTVRTSASMVTPRALEERNERIDWPRRMTYGINDGRTMHDRSLQGALK